MQLLFQAYATHWAVSKNTWFVFLSFAAIVTALLRNLKNRSTLTALWLPRVAEWKRSPSTHLFEHAEEGTRCVDDHEAAEADLQ